MNSGISDKAFRVLSYRGHSHRLFKKEATKAYTAKGRKGLLMEFQNCGEKDQTKNVNAPMEQEQSPLQQNLEEKGVQILENNDRIETSVSQCRIKGELVTQESIVKTQPAAERMEEPNSEPEETR